MLSRRIVRIKAMQGLYAAYMQQKTTSVHRNKLASLQKGLPQDIEQLKHTHLQFLLLLLDWSAMDQAVAKDFPTQRRRLLKENRWFQHLEDSVKLHDLCQYYRVVPWAKEVVQLCYYDGLSPNNAFISYQEQDNAAPKAVNFIQAMVKDVVFASETLQDLVQKNFPDWSLYRTGFESFFLAFVRKFAKQHDDAFSTLHHKGSFVDARTFYDRLVGKLVEEEATFDEKLKEKTHHWDLGRIFGLDRVLIKMGMAESMLGLPKAVIINEYVAIAKLYSTPQSHQFVNALLDQLI